MNQVQSLGNLEPQFRDIFLGAIDKRRYIDVITEDVGVTFEVAHGLGRVPLGFLVINKDQACDIYDGGNWTAEHIYLVSTKATANVRLLIL